MTDKEFKRLNRSQLIDIIYQFQLQVDKLTEQNQELERKLADKRLRLGRAGNIADAALEMNNCFRDAQNAAEQYLNEIKAIREETETVRQRIFAEAKAEAAAYIAEAKAEAAACIAEAKAEATAYIAEAKNKKEDFDSEIEMILKEYEQNHLDNR